MAGYEKDDLPMLSDSRLSNENVDSRLNVFASRTRSASLSIPMNSTESYEPQPNLVGHTGPLRNERRTPFIQMSGPLYISRHWENNLRPNQGVTSIQMPERKIETYPSFSGMEQNDWSEDSYAKKNEHLLRSGQLGMCNDPYCTTCPTFYNYQAGQAKHQKTSRIFDAKYNALYGDAKGCARRFFSFLSSFVPGIMNPHTKVVQQWNQFYVISCLAAIFIDPSFFFLLHIERDSKCIAINWPWTTTIVFLRSVTDFVYLLNMLLQFRLAYVAPESMVVGAGELVDHPKKIALNYLRTYFCIDFFIALPLPQIMILIVLPHNLALSGANYAKNLLRTAVLVQYFPKLYRFLPLFAGQSSIGFTFESAWANFFMNIFTYVLSGHVIGSGWYLFGLQRVNQCLQDACHKDGSFCKYIDCGRGNGTGTFIRSDPNWEAWKLRGSSNSCFTEEGFPYGIYKQAVNLTTEHNIATRYIYSLFWGFQQISTLAGNQTPSYFVWEVLFTMAIIGLGLLLFAFLIGHMQNFLQALVKRYDFLLIHFLENRHIGYQWYFFSLQNSKPSISR
ncbi:probable cyclic nucleotide-gated ion channel 20, chloroplastic [Pistacia vera]|uniref:probable cyclic nucleotide-gated ion channel 20, chloroplastic n=1 Tax=Pistacia vera TaxID=55513 RepID=UPI0012635D9A|nr:probable cyclic nucleotide-gated ion channel 20, chloroplastic [Pistacia vera]